MSISDAQSFTSQGDKDIEPALKDLLEKYKILLYLEKYIETKEDLQQVESELRDYENLVCLVNIIKTVFNTLANKVDLKIMKLSKFNDTSSHKSVRSEEEYEKLEQIIQKHEAEIRTHIRIEQQLKLYAESVQQKLEDSEKTRTDLLDSTKQMINNLKRENQKLSEQNKHMKEEIELLKAKVERSESQLNNLQTENNILQTRFSNQAILAKNYDRRNMPSFSDHKLLQDSNLGDPSTDYPAHSQVNPLKNLKISMKQNFIPAAHTPHKHDIMAQRTKSYHKTETEQARIYSGSMLKSKNNSIASIKEMMNTTAKDGRSLKKKQMYKFSSALSPVNSVAISKNTSLNNSIIAIKQQQPGIHIKENVQEAFMSQQRSKSQQGSSSSQQKVRQQKQRTEVNSTNQSYGNLWKYKA